MLCWILIIGGLLIMMGQHDRSEALFYYFRLEDQVPETHGADADRYIFHQQNSTTQHIKQDHPWLAGNWFAVALPGSMAWEARRMAESRHRTRRSSVVNRPLHVLTRKPGRAITLKPPHRVNECNGDFATVETAAIIFPLRRG
jgi:hypothetical protein